ncbi:2TM domain-containing protein [Polaribacter aestuariivivens]|uniref:2TM domain-containing protein n=1 Tax=Polaribacter aestuariivivens TaxID=2304626 RepID=UPI003F49A939
MENYIENTAYKKAANNVKKIKNFYNHLQLFVIVMFVVVLFYGTIITFFEARISNLNSLKWIKANIWINALLWFFGLIIHGIYVFKFKTDFMDKWEQKKVEEIMKKNKK